MKFIAGRFAGRRAVVTGAGSGIGRATALQLAAEGARVCLIGLNGDALEETASEITATGTAALALVADVTIESEIRTAMDTAAGTWGGLDIIISNAGIELLGQDDRVDRLDQAIWNKLITTNLTGQFLTCKHGARLPARGGRRRDRLSRLELRHSRHGDQ